jgi:TPR repeat protein
MTDISPDALREALQFLIRSDMPADPKRMLIAVVMESLAQREAAVVVRAATSEDQTAWQPTEIDLATTRLQGKVATSWQSADEVLTQLARELHRDAREVRAKALELGFGVAVDYQLAKHVNAKLAEAESSE